MQRAVSDPGQVDQIVERRQQPSAAALDMPEWHKLIGPRLSGQQISVAQDRR